MIGIYRLLLRLYPRSFRLRFRQVLTLSCLGLALGIGGLFLAGRGLRGLLVGVSLTDPVTISLVAAGLGIVAVVAGWSPAWHASRVDPIQALRSE